jgi:hypothetical protein
MYEEVIGELGWMNTIRETGSHLVHSPPKLTKQTRRKKQS